MPVVGVGLGAMALVGKAVGQRAFPAARRYAATAFAMGGGYQLIVGLLMILFRHDLIRFFSKDPEVIRLGGHALIWAGVFQFFDAMGIIYANALRGAGDTHFVMILTWSVIVGLFIPGSFAATWWLMPLIDRELMSVGPWIAGTAYLIVLGMVCWLRWRGRRWQQIDIFGEPTDKALDSAREDPTVDPADAR
jgi:MATE family multidrug resistance protein